MSNGPDLSTAVLRETYSLGEYTAKLFTKSSPERGVLHQFILAVFDRTQVNAKDGVPIIIVSSARGLFTENPCINVFHSGRSRRLDFSPDWNDIEKFLVRALDITTQILTLPPEKEIKRLGIVVKPLFGNRLEVVSVKAGSPADQAGLVPGTNILVIERRPVGAPKEFERAINRKKRDDGVFLKVSMPDGRLDWVQVWF